MDSVVMDSVVMDSVVMESVVMGGADWHQTSLVEDRGNVNIIKSPPYAPQLNPIS